MVGSTQRKQTVGPLSADHWAVTSVLLVTSRAVSASYTLCGHWATHDCSAK